MTNATPIRTLLSALILAALLCGCDDDPVEPETYAGIHGTVVDADGAPMEGVAIGLFYDIPVNDPQKGASVVLFDRAAKPATQISFTIQVEGDVRLWITDYAGDHVRTLVDGPLPAGQHAVVWNGTDDEQNPVPSGMYHYHIQPAGEDPVAHPLFLYFYSDFDAFLAAPNAVTDADGAFRIPDTLIPVGETLAMTDVNGVFQGDYVIPTTIGIVAAVAGDPWATGVRVSIDYLPNGANGDIELILP